MASVIILAACLEGGISQSQWQSQKKKKRKGKKLENPVSLFMGLHAHHSEPASAAGRVQTLRRLEVTQLIQIQTNVDMKASTFRRSAKKF